MSEVVKAPSPNHIRTYTGGWINPLDPDPDAINPEDIAHALANQCRFTGHVRKFYSVAEHSVRVTYLMRDTERGDPFAGLMHDASEAYISDLARPVKRHPAISEVYNEAEERLMQVIADKFGFEWPMGRWIRWADDVLLRTEQRDLMLGTTSKGDVLDEPIEPWTPELAENTWMLYFRMLSTPPAERGLVAAQRMGTAYDDPEPLYSSM